MTAATNIICRWIISFSFNGIESGLLSIDPARLGKTLKRRVPAALQLNCPSNRLLLLATVLLITNAADIIALLLLTRQLFWRHGYAGFLFALLIALPVVFISVSVPRARQKGGPVSRRDLAGVACPVARRVRGAAKIKST